MATGTGQRTITSTTINGGYDVASAQATIDALKGVMVTNAIIYRSHINSLIDLWNAFNGHTHGISDAYQLATFGNNGDRNNYYESDTSNGPNLNADIANVGVGAAISQAKINELITAFSGQLNHSHTWSDRTA